MTALALARRIADTSEACADSGGMRRVMAAHWPDDLDRLDRGVTIVAATATTWVPDWLPGRLDCTWLGLLPPAQAPLWYLTARVPL